MGFLSSMLPTVVGTTVGVATGNPWLGAAAAGAIGYEQSGSLAKGLMAGASAYSGTELAGGIAGLGTSEAGASVDQALQAQQDAAVQKINDQIARSSAEAGQLAPELTESQIAGIRNQVGADWGQPGFELPADVQAKITAAAQNPYSTGLSAAMDDPSKYVTQMGGLGQTAKLGTMAMAPAIADSMTKPVAAPAKPASSDLGIRYKYSPGVANPFPQSSNTGEQTYYPNQTYTRITPDESKNLYGFAAGGDVQGNDPSDIQGDPNMMNVRAYDPVVRMRKGGISDMDHDLYAGLDSETAWELKKMARDMDKKPNVLDKDPMKKAAGLSDMPGLEKYAGLDDTKGLYANGGFIAELVKKVVGQAGISGGTPYDTGTGYTYDPSTEKYTPNMAAGGLSSAASHLGDYSDGGRLLRGPGDGVSDSIPASIGDKRPARLADGEFVVPARIVSELGNGSTEAGARQLYAMMDRVQKARGKTTGKNKVAKDTRAAKYLPA